MSNKEQNQHTKKKENTALDLEVKDAHLIFQAAWSEVEQEYGRENLVFPKEIFWLNGAPGAGKGTQTQFIMELRDITAPPIVISSLLQSPEAKRLIDAGLMVGDREVTSLLIKQLLDPSYHTGVVVDGYPRTLVQVECLKLLYEKLKEVHLERLNTPHAKEFQKPIFHIIVLFVDEPESVKRQIKRGQKIMDHNEKVRRSGVGEIVEVRKTDLSEEAARRRYQTFKEITYDSLRSLRTVFHYHFVDASGGINDVQSRIVDELRYQSSLELNEDTYKQIAKVPIASQIIVHARQELVRRLDHYERFQKETFSKVLEIIERKFIPIIKKHAISGMAIINSEDETFHDPDALAMVIDVFSERGFHAVVDLHQLDVPDRLDPETNRIINRKKKVFRFRIQFPGSEIRRGR